MNKIYGYKEQDVVGLAEFIKDKNNRSLVSLFDEYGRQKGKAKGTVRNLYYAIARRSLIDDDFCKKYLGGQPCKVEKVVHFSSDKERELVKKIILERTQGKSVRGAIRTISKGDEQLALRYQNKYRTVVENKRELIEQVVLELQREGVDVELGEIIKDKKRGDLSGVSKKKLNLSDIQKAMKRLKTELDKSQKRIEFLQQENCKLKKLLYGDVQLKSRALNTGATPTNIIVG
jgi:hypothetical protein